MGYGYEKQILKPCIDAQKIVEDAEAFVSEMHEFIAAQKVLPHDSAFREPG